MVKLLNCVNRKMSRIGKLEIFKERKAKYCNGDKRKANIYTQLKKITEKDLCVSEKLTA